MNLKIEEIPGTRICTACNEVIYEGFIVDTGMDYEYFGEEECLYQFYTPEEYEELKHDDMAHWTQFE
ncbi:hypothetical protein [Bacillus pseudomycoides]|uniref:hypothetical protein n=1 Tax=Bacillus pseudomycoides TaxID=64104 RepID=UPI000BF0C35E|nr:hypothetical protein [Bacillus pseudomycoides]PEK34102.1 hypothetical protein CN691_12860 [Bacillus pseudomycoides]